MSRWWSRLTGLYVKGLSRLAMPISMTFLVATCVMAMWAVRLSSDVSVADTLNIPADSAASAAKAYRKLTYPSSYETSVTVLYYRSTNPQRPVNFGLDPDLDAALLAFEIIAARDLSLGQMEADYNQSHFYGPGSRDLVPTAAANTTITGYFSYSAYSSSLRLGFPGSVAAYYLGPLNGTMAAFLTFNKSNAHGWTEEQFVDAALDRWHPAALQWFGLQGEVTVEALALSTFLRTINSATAKDLTGIAVVMPAALGIFAASLSSVRVLLIAVPAILCTLIISTAILDWVALGHDVSSMGPGVVSVMSLVFGFNFVYSAVAKFYREVLDRLADCVDSPEAAEAAVTVDLEAVVHTVVDHVGFSTAMSTLCIAGCCTAVITFPVGMLQSVGLAVLMSAVAALITTLLLVPAMLLAAPEFFARGCLDCQWCHFGDPADATLLPSEETAAFDARDDLAASIRTDHPGVLPPGVTSAAIGGLRRSMDPSTRPAFRAPSQAHTPRHDTRAHPARLEEPHRSHGGSFDVSHLASGRASMAITRQTAATIATASAARLQSSRRFFRFFTAFLCQPRVAVVSVVLSFLLCVAPAVYAWNVPLSGSVSQFAPRNSGLLASWDSMLADFGPGIVLPYHLIVETNVPSPYPFPLWGLSTKIAQDLTNIPLLNQTRTLETMSFSTMLPASQGGGALDTTALSWCLSKAGDPHSLDPFCKYGLLLQDMYYSKTKRGVFAVKIAVKFDPVSPAGREVYHQILDEYIPKWKRENAQVVNVYLEGWGSDTITSIDYADKHTSTAATISGGVLLVLLVFGFCSLLMPLRMTVVVILTVFVSMGMANIVFGHGFLSFLPVAAFQGTEEAIAWFIPFAGVLFSLAIGLHYEVTATTRVLEMRDVTDTTTKAIVLAAMDSGAEVNICVAMTTVTFGGLLLSEVPAMNQLGLFLLSAALIHGFLLRPFLSTPLFALCGEANLFPRSFFCRNSERHVAGFDTIVSDGDVGSPGSAEPTMALRPNGATYNAVL